jgi:hypothetical protein
MGLGEAPRATLNMVAHMLEGPAVHVERRCIGRFDLSKRHVISLTAPPPAPHRPPALHDCIFNGCLYPLPLANNSPGRVPRLDALNHLPR